jgi:hypothetical protein
MATAPAPLHQFSIPAILTKHGDVLVEATTAEEALAKFEQMQYEEQPGMETTNWVAEGKPEDLGEL